MRWRFRRFGTSYLLGLLLWTILLASAEQGSRVYESFWLRSACFIVIQAFSAAVIYGLFTEDRRR